jgi:hypothetical protein
MPTLRFYGSESDRYHHRSDRTSIAHPQNPKLALLATALPLALRSRWRQPCLWHCEAVGEASPLAIVSKIQNPLYRYW